VQVVLAPVKVVQEVAAEKAATQIQNKLWLPVVAAAQEAPTPITGPSITALNGTIDPDASRMNALLARVPTAAWLLVLIVEIVGCCVTGCAAEATGARSRFTHMVLPLLVAVVLKLIADLDHPRGGLIGINQRPLTEFKNALRESRQGEHSHAHLVVRHIRSWILGEYES
jgi:hypothetical protein